MPIPAAASASGEHGAVVQIGTQTLTSATIQIAFNNIPQIYQDLLVVCSLTKVGGAYDPWCSFNGDFTANTVGRTQWYGLGGSTSYERRTNDSTIYMPMGLATPTLNSYCHVTLHIPNYTSSYKKTVLMEIASEQNYLGWTSLAIASKTIGAVNSVTIHGNDANFAVGSTATVYGVRSVNQ